MCPSSGEKDFGLVDSILIIDEAQELIRDASSGLSSQNCGKLVPVEFPSREGTDADSENEVNVPDRAKKNLSQKIIL